MKGLLFTFALTYGGSLAALVRPWYGFLVYVAFAIIKPDAHWGFILPKLHYSRTIMLCLLFGWALSSCGSWTFGRARACVGCLLALWAWVILGAMMTGAGTEGWKHVEEYSKTYLAFMVGITLIDSVEKVKQLAWAIVLSQGFLAIEFNQIYFFSGVNLAEIGYGGLGRALLGVNLVSTSAVCYFLLLSATRPRNQALAAGLLVCLVHAVLLTFSRGALLGAVVSFSVCFLLQRKSLKHCLIFAVMLAIGLYLVGPTLRNRFFTTFASDEERDESADSRLVLWGMAIDMAKREPLFGVGLGQYGDHSALRYGRQKEAHSLWLQTAAESGIPALVLLAGFYLILLARLRRFLPWPEDEPTKWYRLAAVMTMSSLSGFIVMAQFVSILGLEVPYYIALMGCGAMKVDRPETMGVPASSPVDALERAYGRSIE